MDILAQETTLSAVEASLIMKDNDTKGPEAGNRALCPGDSQHALCLPADLRPVSSS